MRLDFGKCLILSPHADDWLLGCWSIIHRFEGEVHVTAYSGPSADENQVIQELTETVKHGYLDFWEFTKGEHDYHDEDGLIDEIYKIVERLKPTTLFLPGGIHRVHRAVASAGLQVLGGKLPEITALLDSSDPEYTAVASAGLQATLNKHVSWVFYLPSIKEADQKPPANGHIKLTSAEETEKTRIFRETWKSQEHRAAYCQLGELERFRVGWWEM